MTVVRKLYPEEIQEHVRSQIWATQKTALGLLVCESGMLLDFPEQAPISILPAVMVDLVEDGIDLEKVPVGTVEVEYLLEIHYVRALADSDKPKKNLYAPAKALREFFLRDKSDLPLLELPGHQILSALPGKCVYGEPYEPEELGLQGHLLEQAAFRLLVRARSSPVPL